MMMPSPTHMLDGVRVRLKSQPARAKQLDTVYEFHFSLAP